MIEDFMTMTRFDSRMGVVLGRSAMPTLCIIRFFDK